MRRGPCPCKGWKELCNDGAGENPKNRSASHFCRAWRGEGQSMRYTRRVIGGILVVACATLGAQQSQQARSSASGVYSAEQAAAGEKIYFEKCAVCHGDDLAGREKATALTG